MEGGRGVFSWQVLSPSSWQWTASLSEEVYFRKRPDYTPGPTRSALGLAQALAREAALQGPLGEEQLGALGGRPQRRRVRTQDTAHPPNEEGGTTATPAGSPEQLPEPKPLASPTGGLVMGH